MRHPSTFLDDLQLLKKLFQLPEKLFVYDPKTMLIQNVFDDICIFSTFDEIDLVGINGAGLINFSFEKLPVNISDSFECILDFKSKVQHFPMFFTEQFYFINSPDGTVRWVFPKDLKYPGFLSLYNSSGFKASVFQQVVKLAYQTQTQHLICSGKFNLYSKKEKHVKSLFTGEDEDFSIFTGTVGPNRKAIIALHKNKKTTHFIKFPLTEKSKTLVQNEWNHLRCLEQFQFKNITMPRASSINGGIKLSNIKPGKFLYNSKLQNIHFAAVSELYDQTTQFRNLSSISTWQQALDTIFSLIGKVENSDFSDSIKVRQLIGKMYELSLQFDEDLEIPIAYSHGDFTPWNMYLSKERLYLYDWELASIHRPILFDLFHYIFQSHVLIKRSSFKVIAEAVQQMRLHPSVRKLIGKYDIDFDLQYQLYLLLNCSYYIDLFIDQRRLHKQVFWLIDCWLDAFKDLASQKIKLLESNRA